MIDHPANRQPQAEAFGLPDRPRCHLNRLTHRAGRSRRIAAILTGSQKGGGMARVVSAGAASGIEGIGWLGRTGLGQHRRYERDVDEK